MRSTRFVCEEPLARIASVLALAWVGACSPPPPSIPDTALTDAGAVLDDDARAIDASDALPDAWDALPDLIQTAETATRDIACGDGLAACSSACVDVLSAIDHCGDCTTRCTAASHGSAMCTAGHCTSACDAAYRACGAFCVLPTDPAACGPQCTPCLRVAHSSPTCDGSVCGFACDPGYSLAGNQCVADPGPRPIAPLSTSTVTSRRPYLRWSVAAGSDGTRIELCRDRACAISIATVDAPSSSIDLAGALTQDLLVGPVFWRLQALHGGIAIGAQSATWEFFVGHRTAAVSTAWGTVLDVNGDGLADVAVGAPSYANATGRVFVYLGRSSVGTGAATILEAPDGAGSQFGESVASAGDVDGDGFGDLVVGAPAASSRGRMYVYLGGPMGLATTAMTIQAPGNAFASVTAGLGDVDLDGYGDVAVAGPHPSDGSALDVVYLYRGGPRGLPAIPAATLASPFAPAASFAHVEPAGDLNGDHYADLLVGAPYAPRGFPYGAVAIYYGSATGLPSAPSAQLIAPENTYYTLFGARLAGAMDLNGDGQADIAVGAETLTTPSRPGRTYVYYAHSSGVADRAVPDVTLYGSNMAGDEFGGAVASARDLDGDGFDDLAVGQLHPPSVYLWRGGPAGLVVNSATAIPEQGTVGGHFGEVLAGIGDVQGDGYAVLAIGANCAPYNPSLTRCGPGQVWFLSGASAIATIPQTMLTGPDPADGFGTSIAAR